MLIAVLASLLGFVLFVLYGWAMDRLLRPHRDSWCRDVARDADDPSGERGKP